MAYLYRQEIFKLLKRKSTIICVILLLLQNIGFAILGKMNHKIIMPKEFFAADFGTTSFLIFFMIAASATIIASEFEYNTIKNIVSRSYSRKLILASKWLAILTYTVIVYILISIITLVNKYLVYGDMISLSDKVNKDQTVLQYWLNTTMAAFISLWFLLSLVFLIAIFFKKGSAAISIGIVGYFAISTIGSFMFTFIHKHEFLKWNPLNFMNYPTQVAEPQFKLMTHLSNNEMLVGSLTYIVLFLIIGLFLFSRKEV